MLNGVARLINAYGDALKDSIFKAKLGQISVKELSRTARDRRSGSLGFAEAILIYYNKKAHNGLKWEKLYTHKVKNKYASENLEGEEETESAQDTDSVSDIEDMDSETDGQLSLDDMAYAAEAVPV